MEDVVNYERVFRQISTGVVEELITHGKTGTELDISKLDDFIERGYRPI